MLQLYRGKYERMSTGTVYKHSEGNVFMMTRELASYVCWVCLSEKKGVSQGVSHRTQSHTFCPPLDHPHERLLE